VRGSKADFAGGRRGRYQQPGAVVDGDWVHVSGTDRFQLCTTTISDDVVEQAEQSPTLVRALRTARAADPSARTLRRRHGVRARRNATNLRLILGDIAMRQPRTLRSDKINMSRAVRPYTVCRISRLMSQSHEQCRTDVVCDITVPRVPSRRQPAPVCRYRVTGLPCRSGVGGCPGWSPSRPCPTLRVDLADNMRESRTGR